VLLPACVMVYGWSALVSNVGATQRGQGAWRLLPTRSRAELCHDHAADHGQLQPGTAAKLRRRGTHDRGSTCTRGQTAALGGRGQERNPGWTYWTVVVVVVWRAKFSRKACRMWEEREAANRVGRRADGAIKGRRGHGCVTSSYPYCV
jgi:hypothetical protein